MDPTYGRAKAGRPARTYIQQLCEDTGCRPEDRPEVMNDREKWRERVRDICASGTTWWWWWWWWWWNVWKKTFIFYQLFVLYLSIEKVTVKWHQVYSMVRFFIVISCNWTIYMYFIHCNIISLHDFELSTYYSDNADDPVLLPNTPAQDESLLHGKPS